MKNFFKKFLIGTLVVVALAIASGASAADFGTTTLKVGSKGPAVVALQTLVGATADGSFGPITKAKVVAWQKAHGLTADGLFGNISKAKANGNSTNFGAGCTNASGFSTTTGFACTNVNANTFSAGCTNASGFSTTTGLACSSLSAHTFPVGCTNASGFSTTTGYSCVTGLPRVISGGGSSGGHRAQSSDATLRATSKIKGATLDSLGTPATTIEGVLIAGAVVLTKEQAEDTSNATDFITSFIPTNSRATITKVVEYAIDDEIDFENDTAFDNEDNIPSGGTFIVQVTAEDDAILYYVIRAEVQAVGEATAATSTSIITYTLRAGTFDATTAETTTNWILGGDDFAELGAVTDVVLSVNDTVATITVEHPIGDDTKIYTITPTSDIFLPYFIYPTSATAVTVRALNTSAALDFTVGTGTSLTNVVLTDDTDGETGADEDNAMPLSVTIWDTNATTAGFIPVTDHATVTAYANATGIGSGVDGDYVTLADNYDFSEGNNTTLWIKVVSEDENATLYYKLTVTVDENATVVELGTADDFAIFANTGISSTGTTSITGDIGVGPARTHTAITGNFALALDSSTEFATSTLVTGRVYAYNYTGSTPAKIQTASDDMGTAYTDANSRPTDVLDAGSCVTGTCDLAGLELVPGVYTFDGPGIVTITDDVTLAGGPTDVWIFQIPGNLSISSAKSVLLDGASSANIFWAVAGTTTLGTTSTFEGNILGGPGASTIAMQNGSTLNGKALGQTDVTLIAATIGIPAPVIATASTITEGDDGATIVVTGTGFDIAGEAGDLTIGLDTTNLTVDSVTFDNTTQITIVFTGTVATGDITIQALTTAFSPVATAVSNELTVSVTIPPMYAVGDVGPAGGLIFYVQDDNTGGWRYLEAAAANFYSSDLGSTRKWSDPEASVIGTDDAIGTGQANTTAILAHISGETGRAAQVCDALDLGASDWFLPSIEELNEMYTHLDTVGGFLDRQFWSSTETPGHLADQADVINFVDGTSEGVTKSGATYVRCARAISESDLTAVTPTTATFDNGDANATITVTALPDATGIDAIVAFTADDGTGTDEFTFTLTDGRGNDVAVAKAGASAALTIAHPHEATQAGFYTLTITRIAGGQTWGIQVEVTDL